MDREAGEVKIFVTPFCSLVQGGPKQKQMNCTFYRSRPLLK
jgi:hypothetical protein